MRRSRGSAPASRSTVAPPRVAPGRRAGKDRRAVRLCRSSLAVWLTALVLLVVACHRDARPRGIVLVTVDTLRADHLGAYGYSRPTSPFIDGLAATSTVFENAVP